MKKRFLSMFMVCIVITMLGSVAFANEKNGFFGGAFEQIKEAAAESKEQAIGTAKDIANKANGNKGGLYGIDPSFDGDLGEMNTPLQNVLGVIQVVGFVVAIVMVMYVGIKYLTAGAGQKAEVKSTMVPMLVGAAMVGLAPTLVKWIFEIFI